MPELDDCLLLHDSLRRTAHSSPDEPAIVEEKRVVTFGQLWADVTALAAFLHDCGLKGGERVALLLPKSIEGITSMFACLLAGAVYVPIQPRWPIALVKAILAECEPRFLIAEPNHDSAGQSPDTSSSQPVILDLSAGTRLSWEGALSHPEKHAAESSGEAGDPEAFILFTSGSTGRPKGVTISHRAVGSFVTWSAEEFQINARDRIACPAPLTFDLSTFDVFNMALTGAACHIVPENVFWIPRFLAQFVLERRITVWYSVPSILTLLLDEKRFTGARLNDLRLVIFAGEVFPSPNLARLQAAVPGAVFYNLYGPTETNVVTYYRVPEGFDPSRAVPIGRACPYANVLLSPETISVRNGEPAGELLIAGQSVMSRYWNKPEETKRAFVDVSLGPAKGQRFYRSGDQVVRHENGEYTLVGRLDRQVKRRGFRIELGEIEAALQQHADIAESAVISTRSATGVTTITAFLRPRAHTPISEVEVRTHCTRHLPLYMLPDQMIVVDAIPRGDRGKTDYAALVDLCARREHGGCSSDGAQAYS